MEWRRSCSPPLTFTRTTHTSVHSLAPGYGAWAVEPETVHSPKAAPYVALGLVMLSSTSGPLSLSPSPTKRTSYSLRVLLGTDLCSVLRRNVSSLLDDVPFDEGEGDAAVLDTAFGNSWLTACVSAGAALPLSSLLVRRPISGPNTTTHPREREPDPLVLVPVLPYRPIRSRSIQQRDVQPARM